MLPRLGAARFCRGGQLRQISSAPAQQQPSTKRSSRELRKTFLDFFQSNEHTLIPSAPLMQSGSPPMNFTRAGVNRFKPVLTGEASAPAIRVSTVQECVRTADLTEVGGSGRHHSFFEMLCSWSFGGYSRKVACEMAWNLLTKEMGLEPANMCVTYFAGCPERGMSPDKETKQIWRELGIPMERIIPSNFGDNFWSLDKIHKTGPCGPSTEIHFDSQGFDASRVNQRGSSCVELWNLVFIGSSHTEDGSLTKLPMAIIDTGMGLERITAMVNGATSNYDTDLFLPLFQTIENVTGCPAYEDSYRNPSDLNHAYRVLADHMRLVTASVTDGIFPDTSYHLEKAFRRSLHLSKNVFGADHNLLSQLATVTSDVLGEHYKKMPRNVGRLDTLIEYQIEQWRQKEELGRKMYPKLCQQHPGFKDVDLVEAPLYCEAFNLLSEREGYDGKSLSGEDAILLYESVGLHPEQLETLATKAGLLYNPKDFNKALKQKQEETVPGLITNSSFEIDSIPDTDDSFKYEFQFVQKDVYRMPYISAQVLMIFDEEGNPVKSLKSGERGRIHTDKTTFFAESGGQVGDVGKLSKQRNCCFMVEDCRKMGRNKSKVAHIGKVEGGSISVGDKVKTKIDGNRLFAMQNQTGLHMLHCVLNQKLALTSERGSSVTPEGFRLDLATFGAKIDAKFIDEVEEALSLQIGMASPIQQEKISRHAMENISPNAVQVPGTIYPEKVTLIHSPGGQIKPCAGTHLFNSSDLQALTVVDVQALNRGEVQSFHCVTGRAAVKAMENGTKVLAMLQKAHDAILALKAKKNFQSKSKYILTADKHPNTIRDRVSMYYSLLPYTVREESGIILDQLQLAVDNEEEKTFVGAFARLLETSADDKFILYSSNIPHGRRENMETATAMCSDKPVLVVNELRTRIIARATVPKSFQTEDFSAATWLTCFFHCINKMNGGKRAKGSRESTRGIDVKLAAELLRKNKEGLPMSKKVLANALQKADAFAREHVK